MSTLPTDNTTVFVICTNQYTGNFEREMTAYITGQIGDCEVGKKTAKQEGPNILHWNWYEEHVKQVSDEHGTARPTSIWQIPEDGQHHNGYSGVAIFLEERPPTEVLEEMKTRATAFAAMYSEFGVHYDIKILGFWLVDYRVEITEAKEVV